ncbi:hypothetical protein EDC01DRAFT_621705 [Geopyxis carbonaria]|nr:hypothetical protein EDC01DRAFT_621705 [Geopyxis carbonaria]
MFATTHTLPPKPVFDHFSQAQATASPATRSPPPRVSVEPTPVFQYAFTIQLTIAPSPRREDILYATKNAEINWTHSAGCPPEQQLPSQLPFYQVIIRDLDNICKEISERGDGCLATVKVTESQSLFDQRSRNPSFETQRPKRDIAIAIWLAAPENTIAINLRSMILARCPVSLKTACIDFNPDHYFSEDGKARPRVLAHLEHLAKYTGTDIFVLRPEESRTGSAGDPEVDASQGKRLRVKIYGDLESVEHAKTRVLLMIDDMLGQVMHAMYLDVSTHTQLCGRARKNIKQIESATRTAIYFPPPFPRVYGYVPPGANRRHPDEIFISGATQEDIHKVQLALNHLSCQSKPFVKETSLSFRKIDFLLLERLDDIKKIMDLNGTHVQFPALGSASSAIRVQGLETLHIERTIRAIMQLAGQYYDSTWWILNDQINADAIRVPTAADFQQVLIDVSTKSGADICFCRNYFDICGSDWAVRRCIDLLHDFDYARCTQYQLRVKIELANEHKEFVAGKKNGKINKIMGQANIHILFDGFNEYNFYIDVVGSKFDNVRQGLELVEQELPASMAFHVPDSYHKRIIGVGGQHIQTIMKKYSVFVKFSNAMERGAAGKVENEDLKVDNVICRTPARNAANLELVKNDIMEMVQQVDADITTETVEIPRLHHRELIAQRPFLDELERKWSCSVSFPSTEQASDVVTIKGPEWQIPHFKEGLLALVPEDHQIRLTWTPLLDEVIHNDRFATEIVETIKNRLNIDVILLERVKAEYEPQEQAIKFAYTRNNAGGLQDAIELLSNHLLSHGVQPDVVKGRLSRPKSDSFEDFAPFFSSAVLQKAGGGSQDNLNRPGSRLSGDTGSIFGDKLQSEPGRIMSDAEAAFYNGDRRRPSVPDHSLIGLPPGSSGSASSRASIHSRAGSLDSDWEKLSSLSRS